ncbi:MAG: hypothetical protein ACE5EJ_04535 [Nitrosopumilaceae archaeon]
MKEELEQLEKQRKRAKEALDDVETTISELKQSTGYKIHAMLERNNLNGVKKISPRYDGTHVIFSDNKISAETLDKFKKFKLGKLYSENGSMVAVFE